MLYLFQQLNNLLGETFVLVFHLLKLALVVGLAAVLFFPITGSGLMAVLIGTVFGIIAGFAGELVARVVYAHGDTHVDPPAGIIWFMNTLVVVCAGLFA